jgi:hypothetical protein
VHTSNGPTERGVGWQQSQNTQATPTQRICVAHDSGGALLDSLPEGATASSDGITAVGAAVGSRTYEEAHVQQAVAGALATGAKAVAMSTARAMEGKQSAQATTHFLQRAIGPARIFVMRTHPPAATAASARAMNGGHEALWRDLMDAPPRGGEMEDQRLRERLMLPVRSGGGDLTDTAPIRDGAYYGSAALTAARMATTIPAVVLDDPEAEGAHGDVRTFRLDAVPELAEVEGRLLADEKVAAALSGGLLASQFTKPQPGVQHTITAVQQKEAAVRHRAALPTARDKGNLDNAAGPHASVWQQMPVSFQPARMHDWSWRTVNLFRMRYAQFADYVPQFGPDGAAATMARCKCKACGNQLDAYGDHAFGCTANKMQRTHTHNDVVAAFRDCSREAARGTVTWRVETSVTDLQPAKAGIEVAAADIPRADLVGVSTQGDGPAVAVDVAIALLKRNNTIHHSTPHTHTRKQHKPPTTPSGAPRRPRRRQGAHKSQKKTRTPPQTSTQPPTNTSHPPHPLTCLMFRPPESKVMPLPTTAITSSGCAASPFQRSSTYRAGSRAAWPTACMRCMPSATSSGPHSTCSWKRASSAAMARASASRRAGDISSARSLARSRANTVPDDTATARGSASAAAGAASVKCTAVSTAGRLSAPVT